MKAFKAAVHYLFNKHLFITNVISCGGLLSLGDYVIQSIEHLHMKTVVGQKKPYDFKRTGRMFMMGVILGPFNHHWYRLLDKYVTGSGMKMVAKKIGCDQAVAGPFFCSTFLIGTGLMEGKSLEECEEEWKAKFLHIYMADWCMWPAAQSINFYFLPPRFRVLYVAMITLVWNTFLSFMKHWEDHHDTVTRFREDAWEKDKETKEESTSAGSDGS